MYFRTSRHRACIGRSACRFQRRFIRYAGRAIKKRYGEKKEYSIVFDKDNGDDVTEYDFGAIEKYYTVGEDKLFKATGYNGYKNGTVTLWIKVTAKDGKNVIDKVILESYEKQTLMSKLGNDYYDGFRRHKRRQLRN